MFCQTIFYRGNCLIADAFPWQNPLSAGENSKTLARSQLKTEDRRQKTEDRRQKTEDRRQKTEDRRQKTEDRRQK
ncbi:DUF874 family protein [Plesiomonas shigelloides]|uniref:DUF874 family protein n=1 Tax=Plesiomonas shigelloides TaxID=703 RepID=UPI003D333C05